MVEVISQYFTQSTENLRLTMAVNLLDTVGTFYESSNYWKMAAMSWIFASAAVRSEAVGTFGRISHATC